MNDDTAPGGLDAPHRRRVRWDPTINLGHVLTFLGFIATGAVGYFDLRERIAVQEVRQTQFSAEMEAEKNRLRDTLKELRDDVREVRRGIDDLARRAGGRP